MECVIDRVDTSVKIIFVWIRYLYLKNDHKIIKRSFVTLRVRIHHLLTIIRLGWKSLVMTNTLAYTTSALKKFKKKILYLLDFLR